jgi:hypothetical protein
MLTAEQPMHVHHSEGFRKLGKSKLVMHHHSILSQVEPSTALMERLKDLGNKAHGLEKARDAGTDNFGVLKTSRIDRVHAAEEDVFEMLRDVSSIFVEYIREVASANYFWTDGVHSLMRQNREKHQKAAKELVALREKLSVKTEALQQMKQKAMGAEKKHLEDETVALQLAIEHQEVEWPVVYVVTVLHR